MSYFWSIYTLNSGNKNRCNFFCGAHAKVEILISDVQFPGNRFELGIIENDFWSSTICYSDSSFIPWVRKSWKIPEFSLFILFYFRLIDSIDSPGSVITVIKFIHLACLTFLKMMKRVLLNRILSRQSRSWLIEL